MYLVIDEYASLMPDGEYNKDIKEIKQMIQSMMDRILQISRATGLYAILSTQRATIDKMRKENIIDMIGKGKASK